jgi:hypothetical protein
MRLHTQESHIHRILHHDPRHRSLLRLTDTEDTTKGLLLNSVIPPEIKGDASGCHGEIETKTTAFQAGDKDFDLRVGGECLDSFGAVVGGTVTSIVEEGPSFLSAETADDASEDAKLNEDYDLVSC